MTQKTLKLSQSNYFTQLESEAHHSVRLPTSPAFSKTGTFGMTVGMGATELLFEGKRVAVASAITLVGSIIILTL